MQGIVRAVTPNTFTVQIEMPAAQAQGKDKITLPADQRLASMIVIQQRGADMPERPRRGNK
jgi:hypothetical protein